MHRIHAVIQSWCHFLARWCYVLGTLRVYMGSAPIADLRRRPCLPEATATSCYHRSDEVFGWHMLLAAEMSFHGRRASPLHSAQWPEKSLDLSDTRSWSWTNYIKHTFYIKSGISNPGQETAIWLRSILEALLYTQSVRLHTSLSTYVSDGFQL